MVMYHLNMVMYHLNTPTALLERSDVPINRAVTGHLEGIQTFKKSLFGGGLFLCSWICTVNLDLALQLDSSLSKSKIKQKLCK